MSWFLVILFLIVTFGTFSEASHHHHHHKKPLSAVVVGTVYCDTCFQQDFSMGNHFISGASVEVECKDGNEISKPRFKKQVKTNEHGEFKIQLPFSVSKHVKRIKGCVVKLVSSNEPFCSIASAASSSSLHLKSRKQGLHIFSAGFFSFKPLKQPNLCNQKPSVVQNTKKLLDSLKKTSFPPKIDPSFPPPFQPPTPTPLVPNNPFLPPPSGSSPLFPFPSVPGLSPSPPPSSPPGLAFPFPPLFPPPGSGTPPASTKNVSP
uniref:Pollen Ole e I family allergen n=1 Tax=Medicago truncatula TaxID=3880 RepID=B7FKI5_MEDTR|nr:unknown [Medicago truncatula]